jgi:hypothetical protein
MAHYASVMAVHSGKACRTADYRTHNGARKAAARMVREWGELCLVAFNAGHGEAQAFSGPTGRVHWS